MLPPNRCLGHSRFAILFHHSFRSLLSLRGLLPEVLVPKAIVQKAIVQKAEIASAVFATAEILLAAFVMISVVLASLPASLLAETCWHHSGLPGLVILFAGSHQSG